MVIKTKIFSTIMLALLLSSMLVFAFSIHPVESDWTWSETVYILADGSIDPPDAPISTTDNITYALTSNIIGGVPENGIAVKIERDDIVVDGAGHRVEGVNASESIGIVLNGRRNVTIANMETRLFAYGILLCHSNYTRISENNITENGWGIRLYPNSHYNIITRNNITRQYGDGIRNGEQSAPSNHNVISDNNFSENLIGVYVAGSLNLSITRCQMFANIGFGVRVDYSSSSIDISQNNMTGNGIPGLPGAAVSIWNSTNCQVKENWIANNNYGLYIECTSQIEIVQNDVLSNSQGVHWFDSSNDIAYHNNFVDNSQQVHVQLPGGSVNSWDNGYPSGGNYWNDYTGIDLYSGSDQNEAGSDGMGDTPYVINENNTDRYPLANPWPSGWKLDFIGPTNHPIVDFAVYNRSLYAAADNRLYTYDGSNWNAVNAPTFVTSLETRNVTSQQPASEEWNRTYGGAEDDYAYDLIWTSDGGYAMAGFTWSYGEGVSDYWLIKTDPLGNIQWNKTYGGPDNDVAYALVQTTDGGYALGGRTLSFGAGAFDFWLVKTDAYGNAQWNKTYGGTSSDWAFDLVQTVDGGYALAGYTFSYGSGIGQFSDAWLVKTDTDGEVLWNETYGGVGGHDQARALIQTADGGYALAGVQNSLGIEGCWLIKTDSTGTKQWDEIYGGAGQDLAEDVVQTNDGGYAIAGWTSSYGAGLADFWLIATDSLGGMLWNHTYGGTGEENAYALALTDDGGYAMVGTTFGTASETGYDFWLVKTDALGNACWNETYGGTVHDDMARALVQTGDGGYALAGYTWSHGAGSADFWFVKTESYNDSYERLIVGGQGGLYCYDGASFDLIFSVPTYIKVLGVYSNALYAGTMFDNPPKLYYCNGSADNPSNWHLDPDFAAVHTLSGPFGSIDSFQTYDDNAQNLIGYWRFDESSGNTACDSSGNGHDGTIYGASWTTGITGNGLGFDGDDLVVIPDSPNLNPSEITVETWVSFSRLAYGGGYSGTDDQMLVCKGGWPRGGSYRIWQGGPNSSFQVLFFDLGWLETHVASPEITLQTNRWYHLAGTYDGNMIKLYLDGVLQASRNIGSVPVGNAEPLYFGYHDETGWNYYLNGSLDETAIYSYAKTAEEIHADYVSEYGKMYIASGGSIFCYNGTGWNIAGTLDDVYAYIDMEVYDGKMYLATRDQGWRNPRHQGGTGFSGRVIEFDGENWTTILDHDYWVYSLGVYDGKLYAGTANKILTYDGSNWETSFNASEGAYYALCFENYGGKIYVGMGNGHIFADPIPESRNQQVLPQSMTTPEYPKLVFAPLFIGMSLTAVICARKKIRRKLES